jgi:CBS domain-containing protein
MIAKDIMTNEPYVVNEGDSVRAAAELMRAHDIGFVPVLREGRSSHLVGVVTDRDIAVRCVARGLMPDGFVAAFMTKEPLATVRPESPVEEVLQLMERARVRRMPVVDARDRVVGVIALADVVRALGRRDPAAVEELLERVSESAHAVT